MIGWLKLLLPVRSASEEFETGGFTLKTHEMFPVHTTPEEFKNASITCHFHQLIYLYFGPRGFYKKV